MARAREAASTCAPGSERTRARSVAPLVGVDLALRRVRVHPREVVFLKGVIEASEGLAVVFAEAGGDLTIATTAGQLAELDRTLRDLEVETCALVQGAPSGHASETLA